MDTDTRDFHLRLANADFSGFQGSSTNANSPPRASVSSHMGFSLIVRYIRTSSCSARQARYQLISLDRLLSTEGS